LKGVLRAAHTDAAENVALIAERSTNPTMPARRYRSISFMHDIVVQTRIGVTGS
jgi:hypothetical protein